MLVTTRAVVVAATSNHLEWDPKRERVLEGFGAMGGGGKEGHGWGEMKSSKRVSEGKHQSRCYKRDGAFRNIKKTQGR